MTNKLGITIKSRLNCGNLELKKKKNAFFIDGGGTKGPYAVGVFRYLFEKNPYLNLADVDIFGGTSVGSYLATALSIGYDKNDFITMSKTMDISNLVDSKYLFMITIWRFIRLNYLYDDKGRESIVQMIIDAKIDAMCEHLGRNVSSTDITIGDLKQLINTYPDIYKHLIVNTVDISANEQIFMTTLDSKSDNIKLFDALLASSSIPFVFRPSIFYRSPEGQYGYEQKPGYTTNTFIDGGVCTNNPLDYFLLNEKKFKQYDLWLLEFTKEPTYTNVYGFMSLLEQLIDYLITGKNDVKMDLVKKHYQINTINLCLRSGTLDICTKEQIQATIEEIYEECVSGNIYFENNE